MRKTLAATSILVTISLFSVSICPSAMAAHRSKPGGRKITARKIGPEASTKPGPQTATQSSKIQLTSGKTTAPIKPANHQPAPVIASTIKPLHTVPSQSTCRNAQVLSQGIPEPQSETPSQSQSTRVSTLYDQSRYDDCAFWIGDDSGLSLGSDDLSLSVAAEPNQSEAEGELVDNDIKDNTRSVLGACFLATGAF